MCMNSLPKRFALWVLVWFGLTLAAATAAPAGAHPAGEPICTSAGMVWVPPTDDAPAPSTAPVASSLHCLVCAPALGVTAPPTTARFQALPTVLAMSPPVVHEPIPLARAPLPSRGPPAASTAIH